MKPDRRMVGWADGQPGAVRATRTLACALVLSVHPTVRLSAQLDRTKPPTLPPAPALKLPAAENATLSNGLRLTVIEMHKVPVVNVQVLLDAGAAHDQPDAPGLATFTALMLEQGAGARGAIEVADEAAFLGAQLATAATLDGAVATLRVPRSRLEPALDLLADVLLRPTFPDSEVARQRDLRSAQLVQQRDEPVTVANVVFPAIVYGAAHPYGHPLNGTDAATAGLTRERVVAFYRAYYRPNAARVLVV
ncbi:MAG TPA: insulinase family protein, partial [Gemmatimonadales bacterium]|nr:insulinase family protein [Gemmatimonadales bacterium]